MIWERIAFYLFYTWPVFVWALLPERRWVARRVLLMWAVATAAWALADLNVQVHELRREREQLLRDVRSDVVQVLREVLEGEE